MNDSKNNRSTSWISFLILGALVFFIWLASYYYIRAQVPLNLRGTLGDTFGAINSLFSGLAFAGIISTIILQKEELSLQRKELESTRKVFEQQSSLMKSQQYISVFFGMIDNHRSIVKALIEIETKTENDGNSGLKSVDVITEGYKFLDGKVKELNNRVEKACAVIIKREGFSTSFSQEHPDKLFKYNKELLSIFESIKMIIGFIVTKLDNDILYHEILFNSLSKNEKLLIGIYFSFDVAHSSVTFEKSAFNYKSEFRFADVVNPLEYNVPHITIKKRPIFISEESIGKFNEENHLIIENNEERGTIFIERINIQKVNRQFGKETIIEDEFDTMIKAHILPQKNLEYDIFKLIVNRYYDNDLGKLIPDSIERVTTKSQTLKMTVFLIYNDNIHKIKLGLHFGFERYTKKSNFRLDWHEVIF